MPPQSHLKGPADFHPKFIRAGPVGAFRWPLEGGITGWSTQRDAPSLAICNVPLHLPRDPLLKGLCLRLAGLQDQGLQAGLAHKPRSASA